MPRRAKKTEAELQSMLATVMARLDNFGGVKPEQDLLLGSLTFKQSDPNPPKQPVLSRQSWYLCLKCLKPLEDSDTMALFHLYCTKTLYSKWASQKSRTSASFPF